MRYVDVAGTRVSRIGLGTWQFGSGEWGYGADYADRTAGDLVRRALDLGINLIDTAEAYGMGASERIVGQALADRRDEAFVATKLLPVLPLEPIVEWRGSASAARLGIETIDLYQIHWPNPLVPLGVQATGLRRLRDAGVVDHVGVSNFSADRWFAIEQALEAPVLSNQVRYSLVDRRPEADVLPYAEACDRLVIAYSPLGQGLLGGRYDAAHPPSGATLPDVLEQGGPPGQPALPARQPRRRRSAARGAPPGRRRPRRHAGPGVAGVGAAAAERGGHPGCVQRRPARGQRGGGRARPDR